MNVLITGGTGFIGSYIVKEMLDNGTKITILARNPDKVPGLKDLKNVKIIKCLLKDFNIIKKNLKGIDAVIHVALGWGDTAYDMLQNDTMPSVYLMEESAKAGIKKFIYTSSTAVFGSLINDVTEETKTKPIDYYGATKASVENYLFAISNKYQMKCNIIRPGYTFGNPVFKGSYMQPDTRFKDIVKKAKLNNDIELIKNDGTQFIFAGDLGKIYKSVLQSDIDKNIFLGLSSEFVTWEKIAQIATDICSSKSKIILKDAGYNKRPFYYKINKIEKILGLKFKCLSRIKEHIEYLADI